MSFSLFEVALIIGITQGFIISVLIWLKKRNQADKVLLSFLLAVFNFLCIKIMLFTSGLWALPVLRYFPLPFDLAIQPLIFLYVSSLTIPGFRLKNRYFIHFIPFAISFSYSLVVYLAALSQKGLPAKDMLANSFLFNQVKEVEDFLSVISGVLYWAGVLRLVRRYRRWFYNNTSNTLLPAYGWLRTIIVLFGVLFLMLGVNILLDFGFDFGRDHFLHWQLLFVYLAVIIYYMGFRGYRENTWSVKPNMPQEPDTPGQSQPGDKFRAAGDAIVRAFEEDKIHLDPDLNLHGLARAVHLSPAVVSSAINSMYKQNFRNMVNQYRVKEVIARLQDTRSGHLSLLGIAYECGFNSEASFYRIFKADTGVSPKEYLLRVKQP